MGKFDGMSKEEIKAYYAEKKEAKKSALNLVCNFVKENTEDSDLLKAVNLLTVRRVGGGVNRVSILDTMKAMFKEKKSITEGEIFQNFKLGRPEMRRFCKDLIKRAKTPDERIWVAFDISNETYVLVSEGAEIPKGWSGYKPVDIEDLEIED
jgi:hypothetical protein